MVWYGMVWYGTKFLFFFDSTLRSKFTKFTKWAQGPIAAKLASFGKVQALAFGWYGECSPALEHVPYHTIPAVARCRVWFPTPVAAHDGGKPGQGPRHSDVEAA